MSPSSEVVVAFDASPWGLGAVLYLDGVPVAWIANALDEHDCRRYNMNLGDCKGQQIWKFLSVPAALRAWFTYWSQSRFTMGFRGDNVTALTMVMKFKGSGAGVKSLARETAMLLTHAPYAPVVYDHPRNRECYNGRVVEKV